MGMGKGKKKKGKGKGGGTPSQPQGSFERRQGYISTKYCLSRERIHDNDHLYQAYFIKKEISNGEIKDKQINCVVLEAPNNITALYQQDIAKLLGKGALRVHFVDEQYVLIEKISQTFKEWYLSLYKEFEADGWWNSIEGRLTNLLRGFIKSLTKLYPNYSHGNWTNGLAVLENGEAKIYNMKHPSKESHLQDLEVLANILDCVISRVESEDFDHFHEFKPSKASSKNWLGYYRSSGASEEYCHFMSNVRLIIEKKTKNLAPLYPALFWGFRERYHFMEEIYDLFWKEKWGPMITEFEKFFPRNWRWWVRLPSTGRFNDIFYYVPEIAKGHGKKVASRKCDPNNYTDFATGSIKFWRNVRQHYNQNLPQPDTLTVKEIELQLNETFGICDVVFRATYSLLIASENAVRPRRASEAVFWRKLTAIIGNISKA